MLSEVKAYLDLCNSIDERHREAMRTIRMTHLGNQPVTFDDPRYQPYAEGVERERVAKIAARIDAAKSTLATSANQIVAYIGRHMVDGRGMLNSYTETIIRLSPMSVEDLDDYAVNQDWCFEWQKIRQKAALTGEITGLEPLSKERFELLEYIENDFKEQDGIGDLMSYIDAVVIAETKEAPTAS